ncbi:uncharacterized protein EI90DRAFT_2404687 [Cantharellus anzutake]|uniref:uncharacterized protein n=1 Tax=Cantharellus anzutake TaxID=1750568 RepID=UPI0019033BDB|nr:uncharacterized protein EI90DRAFT_2404687 [Cantharellus anzutake]KAF8338725.1 hypothetical protein EI90DRAFT_2404687 [Cantharellus anzutake]
MTNYTHVTLPYGELPKDVINLGTMLGPFFLGQCFNWALFGILCLQIYIYYLRFPNDHKWIKTLAYGTFTLDTFFIICMTHAGWRVLVAYWGDVNIFHELTWTWALLPFSSGFVSMIVQLFFVYRIYRLSHSFAMPFIITMVTVTQCAFAIRTSIIAHNVRSFRYIRDFLPAFWLGGSILADILISSTIVRILWRSKTGFKDTDSVVARLMRLSIEAAAVPTISATIKLIFIYTRHDNVHLVICMLLPRLYSNVRFDE